MIPRVAAVLDKVSPTDSVLDIGCVQHSVENEQQNDDWLHGHLADRDGETVGIDYLGEEVQILQNRGYNVEHQDAEEFSFDRKFDTIVAGELIEHLSNPGNFLDRVNHHLKSNGTFLLTTPNPWAVHRFRAALAGNVNANPEHTMWFDKQTIKELYSRSHLSVVEFEYIKPGYENLISLSNPNIVSLTRLLWNIGFNTVGGPNFLIVAKLV